MYYIYIEYLLCDACNPIYIVTILLPNAYNVRFGQDKDRRWRKIFIDFLILASFYYQAEEF